MALDYVDTIDLQGEQWDFADTNLQNTYLETVYPIGVTYLQFPQQKAPTELFPQFTWEELNYNGAFFRASGGNASSFINADSTLTPQSQGTAVNGLSNNAHRHRIMAYTGGGTGISNVYGGSLFASNRAVSASKGYLDNYYYEGTAGPIIENTVVTIKSSNTETRPINYTIKVWKRTA